MTYLLFTALIVLLSIAYNKESGKPDFSGTYIFNAQKSKLEIPAPSSATFTIEHKEPLFKISRTIVFDEKSDTWGIELTTDGRDIIVEESERTLHCRAYWKGEDLAFDTAIIMKDKRAANFVQYHLSDDGITITATECFRGPTNQYDNIWVLYRS
ncbi:MAG: hypothetical protein A2Y62_20800 [Candidatus Fischerbacteria bacterium RBG_13_37_8]|uniref:Uncharacterized protein n=1 Tax=Candidatus Fischerbacteria bacterium RBG_13_37_8 TaxID=1817863 RepID=A0A1F5VEX5_9BACT|nr:MAG: hypothetical protein A2Y62_20800 [Candidatus Fischerbacteria bacterium RBG_13_37_8]